MVCEWRVAEIRVHPGEPEIRDCACVRKANITVCCRWILLGKVKGYSGKEN